jgi:hypothetical protein
VWQALLSLVLMNPRKSKGGKKVSRAGHRIHGIMGGKKVSRAGHRIHGIMGIACFKGAPDS